MSARDELARTRTMPVPHRADRRPAPDKVIRGSRADLQAHMRESGARAVGHWRQTEAGDFTVPVVYVSRRAQPWVVRHRVGLLATGVPLVVLSGLYLLVVWVGVAWFIGGCVAAAVFVAGIVRFSHGGGRSGTNVSVSVNVRTK